MDIQRMIAVVQLYIGIRKGKEVEINIQTPQDFMLLSQAYSVANDYIIKNNVTINKV